MMNQKAQVTVFIIVGIVILFLFAGILFINQIFFKEKLVAEGESLVTAVPFDFKAIQTYTENCLNQIGTNGLLILGEQGGYIYPELLGEFSAQEPTDSLGIFLEPQKIPYWFYNQEPNKANSITFSSLQPKLYAQDDREMSIETQLERFVEEKMDSCLSKYAVFEKNGYKFDFQEGAENKDVTVTINDDSVTFWLEMDVTAELGKSKQQLNKFYVKLPLNLKHYYEIANDITAAQKQYKYLERQTLGIMSTFSGLEQTDLPPWEATTFELAATKFWLTDNVKEQLKNLLFFYVPMLQVYSSHNLNHYNYPIEDLSALYQQDYDNMILPVMNAEDVEVRFDYFGWNPYLRTNDVEGVIKPQHLFISQWFVNFGMQRYYTVYDLSYPVVVTIDDPLALNGKGYQFKFALESNIRNNQIVEDDKVLPPQISSISESMACQEQHRDTELIKTIVVDSFTKEPIEAVRIGYTIPDQAECEIGFTNQQGFVNEKYPSAIGGTINFIKEDYLSNFYPIDTTIVKDQPAIIGYAVADFEEPVIEMHRFKPISVSVKRYPLAKCLTPLKCEKSSLSITCNEDVKQCFFGKGVFNLPKPVYSFTANNSLSLYNDYYLLKKQKDLLPEEEVAITLTRVADLNPTVTNKPEVITFSLSGTDKTTINLVPGIYQVDGTLVLHKPIVIPADLRSIKFSILIIDKEMEYPIDEFSLDEYMSGKIAWNEDKTYLTITPEDLYTSNELTFYFATQELEELPLKTQTSDGTEVNVRVFEDLQMMPQLGNISTFTSVRKVLEPTWS